MSAGATQGYDGPTVDESLIVLCFPEDQDLWLIYFFRGIAREQLKEYKDSIADSRLTVERPSKNLVGKIGEGGYEVIEYPENTGKWWWKDFENGEWNEWL